MTSVLKGPLSGPSHREVAGVEFGGRSGNASHLDFCLCRRGGGGGEGSFFKDNFQPGFKIWDSQDQRRHSAVPPAPQRWSATPSQIGRAHV